VLKAVAAFARKKVTGSTTSRLAVKW